MGSAGSTSHGLAYLVLRAAARATNRSSKKRSMIKSVISMNERNGWRCPASHLVEKLWLFSRRAHFAATTGYYSSIMQQYSTVRKYKT